ncbi:feruloyl esterase [Gemmatimonadetes bacterium T265]|nr:feruloyl esterase [Gemmatimonadetes bacterium T265]
MLTLLRERLHTALACVALALAVPGATAPAQPAATPGAPPTPAAPAVACASLAALRLPDVRITAATAASANTKDAAARVPHCRVAGVTGKAIRFVVVLPDAWNGRLFMGGNGGFAGSINDAALAVANDGYATVSTDTGHEDDGGPARWALDDPERRLDFGRVAVHRTIEVAKAVVHAYYGVAPADAYFEGCSNGGRQALMEAQRYPSDFDGIIAGAPAIPWSAIGAAFLRNAQAAFPTRAAFAHPALRQAALDALSAAVLQQCDLLDGVRDGIVGDPRACHFRLGRVRACPADRAGAGCLTRAERALAATIYAPTTDAAGRVVYPGQPVGGENLPGGWDAWITGRDTALVRAHDAPTLQLMFAEDGARYFMTGDPTWDYARYDRARYARDARPLATVLDAADPDLATFFAHGGRLLLYHGWADPALNPLETIDYYERVRARDARARDRARLYLLPGVLHCGGGTGPSEVPWLRTLAAWVERGAAPGRLVAARRDTSGRVVRTRPLCAYPARAAYTGTGSTDDAASFACRVGR